LLIPSLNAFAITPIDVTHPASLTVFYQKDNLGFQGLEIKTFRIAEVFEDGTYKLTAPFDKYPVNIYGISSQTEWKNICLTLSSFAIADALSPSYTTQTDVSGKASFESIQTGMYLTLGVSKESSDMIISFESFITLVPYPSEDGNHEYNVKAYPKPEIIIPTPEKKTHKILKQWKDTGYIDKRPENVYVDVYKSGEFAFTQTLNSENNWSYTWESEVGIIWTAVERQIPAEYTVTVTKNGDTIILTNVYDGKEPEPGAPGDDGVIYRSIILMCLSGAVLVILSMKLKRSE